MADIYVLGIGGLLGHDANVALFCNKRLIASSQEERFSRIKHDATFPIQAIDDCLRIGNIQRNQIDVIVFAEKPLQSRLFNFSGVKSSFISKLISKAISVELLPGGNFISEARKLFPRAKLNYAWHHLSHAAGGYHTSKFDKAAFLCIDGKGEDSSASIGIINKNEAKIIKELPFENGLGMLYTIITHYLGFPSFGSEYKVMGLAPYGKPRFKDKIKKLYNSSGKGDVQLKRTIGFHPTDIAKSFEWIYSELQIQQRGKNDDLTSEHIDLASSLQSIFEEEVLNMAQYAKNLTGEENLIFCGGCAQNCVSAGVLRDSKIFTQVFNSPVGGDMASGLGAALLYLRNKNLISDDKIEDKGFYLGSLPGEVTSPDVENYREAYTGSIHEYVASLLAKGKIVGWVRNGMELGARALGARSILANPLDPEMQTKMNLKIKFRESFRPFAPAILEEEQSNWFDCNYPSNFMQYTAYLHPHLRYTIPDTFDSFKARLNYARCSVPSIVHVDFSARLQTVNSKIHPDFHALISEFYKITGVPILINTSFNVNGQPIVRTADEAFECFINTDIDYLVINEKLYKNPLLKTKEEKLQWLQQFEKFSR